VIEQDKQTKGASVEVQKSHEFSRTAKQKLIKTQ